MHDTSLPPRARRLLTRIDAWSSGGRVRAMTVRVGVTVLGPLVVLAGLAMLVLPGPGLVVIALGLVAARLVAARRPGRPPGQGRPEPAPSAHPSDHSTRLPNCPVPRATGHPAPSRSRPSGR